MTKLDKKQEEQRHKITIKEGTDVGRMCRLYRMYNIFINSSEQIRRQAAPVRKTRVCTEFQHGIRGNDASSSDAFVHRKRWVISFKICKSA